MPYNRFLVCDKDLDHVVGFVDSKHLLRCVLEEKPINFRETGLVQPCQFIPDSLTLSEVLDVFQRTHGDFAVILNEYALVVGIITINDVMSTVMADLVTTSDELQIIPREDGTWLVDGSTPIDDLEHALGIDELPEDSAYRDRRGLHDVHAAQDPEAHRQGDDERVRVPKCSTSTTTASTRCSSPASRRCRTPPRKTDGASRPIEKAPQDSPVRGAFLRRKSRSARRLRRRAAARRALPGLRPFQPFQPSPRPHRPWRPSP